MKTILWVILKSNSQKITEYFNIMKKFLKIYEILTVSQINGKLFQANDNYGDTKSFFLKIY